MSSVVVPGFLSKLYEIFSSSEFDDCCKWGAKGESIIVFQLDTFSKKVLPKYFKHQNFQSFVRQLNNYDFRKNTQDPNLAEFHHPFFKKDKPELMSQIKRKSLHNRKESAGAATEGEHNILHPSIIGESDDLLYELNYQRLLHSEFEKKMEAKFSKLEGENKMFKQLFLESLNKNTIMQERMERVLQTIFRVYNATTGNNPQIGGVNNPNMMIKDWQQFQSELRRAAQASGSSQQLVPVSSSSNYNNSGNGMSNSYQFDNQAMQKAVSVALLEDAKSMIPNQNAVYQQYPQQFQQQQQQQQGGGSLSLEDPGRFQRLTTMDLLDLQLPVEEINTPRLPPMLPNYNNNSSSYNSDAMASSLLNRNTNGGMSLEQAGKLNSFDRAASSVSMPTKYSQRMNAYNTALFNPVTGGNYGNSYGNPQQSNGGYAVPVGNVGQSSLGNDNANNFAGQELFRMESLLGSPVGEALAGRSRSNSASAFSVASSSDVAPAPAPSAAAAAVSGLKRTLSNDGHVSEPADSEDESVHGSKRQRAISKTSTTDSLISERAQPQEQQEQQEQHSRSQSEESRAKDPPSKGGELSEEHANEFMQLLERNQSVSFK